MRPPVANRIQRACPAPERLGRVAPPEPCTTADPDQRLPDAFNLPLRFCLDSDDLVDSDRANVAQLRARLLGMPAVAGRQIRIHGYASPPNGPRYNRRLACHRAIALKRLLALPAALPVTLLTHGATTIFGSQAENQRVVIEIIPAPPIEMPPATITAPRPWVCGPDVTSQVAAVWAQIQTTFRGWGFSQKESACRNLIQPMVRRGGSWRLNKDAFDTLGLFQNTMSYVRRPRYHPPCAYPGSTNPGGPPRDEGHESDRTCSNTVKVGSDCWLSGTPNYGTYGVMMRLCWDWTLPLIALGPHFALLNQIFSLASTAAIVEAYKRIDGDDPVRPRRWAMATWMGGASATVTGGNRPRCRPVCPVPYRGPAFDYVWEQARRRSSVFRRWVAASTAASANPP